MSNIFKRLRLIGRREEAQKREENFLNLSAEADQQNSCEPNAKEHLEQIQGNTRGDFRHQRPRYRRSARKRLHFSSKLEEEPVISCRKISQEIPHASHPDAKELNTESCNGIRLTDDSVTKSSVHFSDDVNSKPSTKGANDSMNESFEVLMPDLLSSNADLSTRKITPKSNEATPDPPVLHRMDTDPRTDPRPQSLSKEDVNLPTKSPVARVNARKGECQLLKLLFSDDNTTQNNPLPLLSISKVKSSPASSLGRQICIADVKRKNAGEGSVNNNTCQIEENKLNTPLVESNRQNSTIPLLLSRSSRRRMQTQDGKIEECSDESVAVVETESQRVGEDLRENPSRNNREKQDGQDRESDKENNETIGSDGVILTEADEMPFKESAKSKKTVKEPNSRNSEATALAELETEYSEEDNAQNDDVFDADVQEIQQEKGNDRRELKYQEPKEPTESTEVVEELQLESKEPTELTQVEDGSDQGSDQSQNTNTPHVQGGDSSGLQHREENKIRESSKDPSSQDIAEPTDSSEVVYSLEGVDCPEKNGLKEKNPEGMQCKKDTSGQNDAKELNGQQGVEITESPGTANERKSGRESQDKRIEIGEDVHEMQCNEGNIAEKTTCNFPSVQENSQATELPEIEIGLEETSKESQETVVPIITGEGDAELNLCKEGNDNKDSNRKITRLPKPNEMDNYWNRGVTFESRTFVTAGHLDAQITGDLSPTITPRETYEMFAAPNSHGKFNGRWPMAEGTMSHLAGPRGRGRGRGRKIKTEWCQRVDPFTNGNIDTYSMPWNNMDWHAMMSSSRSHYSQEDSMFAMTGTMSQGQSQDFNNVGGYYSCMMSSREQMPFGSSDDLDVARAASSDSGIDSQGASELESDPSGSKTKKENEHLQGNAAHYRGHEQVDLRYGNNFQPSFDGFYMIDSTGCYVPVNHPYGTMIPPQGFQGGSYGPYGYSGPIDRQYYPNQRERSCTNVKEGTEELSTSGTKQQDSDYQFKQDSSPSILNASAGGDNKSSDETNQQTSQDMQDILDALKILLRDAFDPTVSDPGELLALYGAELLKDEELKLEFIYFCEQLLNYEIMMSQSGGFIPGACGDFTYPYPTRFTNPAMWPPPRMQCSSGMYRNDVSYYYDGESCIPVGVCQDPQGNLRMVLPDGHPDQYGPKDYMLIYGGPDGNAVRV